VVKFIAVLTPIVFVTLLTGWASAKEVEPGRCWREVSFNETRDGSFVVRSAWVCEKTETAKKGK